MPQRKDIIGKAWLKNTPFGVFINVHVLKTQLDKFPVDDFGNIRLTIAELKNLNEEDGATHIVYEDDFLTRKRKTA